MKTLHWVGWCRKDNHDKVWAIMDLGGGQFATIWGRRGKRLQSKIQQGDYWERNAAINRKQDKGYREITHNRLVEVYPEFQLDLEQSAFWLALQS